MKNPVLLITVLSAVLAGAVFLSACASSVQETQPAPQESASSGSVEAADPQIVQATGSTVQEDDLLKEEEGQLFLITDYGAEADGDPVSNTRAINNAIAAAHSAGGGTVVVPEGEFGTYTILLEDNVNFRIDEGAVIRAARTDLFDKDGNLTQEGEGGNYAEPEVFLYTGLQDHGHSYFANSLFYAADKSNIMIYGNGLIDGSCIDDSGTLINVLSGNDPSNPDRRSEPGHKGTWFGNKGIALVRCQNIIFKDFSILNGGHFAIIAEGVTNMKAEGITVDTNRDAFDIDCCQDVTVRNSRFNSLTDDAVVMKASYGAGIFMPTRNVVIEDCTVSGFDAGSVISGTYTTDKLVATDACGPTARVKFGTESTCGYDTVLIQRVHFERSRGFAMEAVDGSPLHDVIMRDCTMNNVSSSPIFIRIGDRGRFPVTGLSEDDTLNIKNDLRLDNSGWVLPNSDDYQSWPAKRYTPSYYKDTAVTVDGVTSFNIVNQETPANTNPASLAEKDGRLFAYTYDETAKQYVPDESAPVSEQDAVRYANANGSEALASVYNIVMENVTVTDADPRYPILLAGLTDSRIRNVVMRNIDVQYRGGLSMKEATEQRQIGTWWTYTQSGSAPSVQKVPWLVNSFFSKAEGLLPRVSYDRETDAWIDDPYNVPELPFEYPEPSILGILPAYGMYARHAEALTLDNVKFSYIKEDTRPAIVLDDTAGVALKDVEAMCAEGVSQVVTITSKCKRRTGLEYIPGEPFFTTTNTDVDFGSLTHEETIVNMPSPGTPADELCPDMKLPIPENGYTFAESAEDYPLPLTVHRPYFVQLHDMNAKTGEELAFTLQARNPAIAARTTADQPEAKITLADEGLAYGMTDGPDTAAFDEASHEFRFTPEKAGDVSVTFTLDDGVIPVKKTITIHVTD